MSISQQYWLLFGSLAVFLIAPAGVVRAQDTDLFTSIVPPNVMLIVDNSGSMAHIVWHPDFDPNVTPTCTFFVDGATYFYSSDLTFNVCNRTRTLYADTSINRSTRITGRYLNWIFSPESDAFQADLASASNGSRSACLLAEGLGATYSKYRRSRITASKEILREVVCNVNSKGDVRFGLTQFYNASDPMGGFVSVPIDDYTVAQGSAIDKFIQDLAAETWTPLSETLYNVYRYFQSRTTPTLGKDGETRFPAYDISTDGSVTASSSAPPSPVQFFCQKNFIIVITDGEPTKDDFDGMNFNRFKDKLIGDYNPNNALPEQGDETPDSCAFCNETTFYLDDIAMFMNATDSQSDVAGDQTIDVYTVGFTTELPANQLLEKTANSGNGLFFHSNNAEDLTSAIIEAVTDVIAKSQSFTSATVPASRTTDGDSFYTSFFLPQRDSGFWQGHLKNFDFSPAGDILNADGFCATGDVANVSPPCLTGGQLRFFDPAFWDSASEIPAPLNRNLYVEFGDTPIFSKPAQWSTANLSAGDLNLVLGVDDGDPPYDGLPNPTAADLTEALVNVVRGCEFGTNCVPRVGPDGAKVYLGDIFHSNPIAIGSPTSAINESSYIQFSKANRARPRVIYAGANDGFLHGFMAGKWQAYELDSFGNPTTTPANPPRHDRGTGEELFGFMPYTVRNAIKELPKQLAFPRTLETVDASPVVADVWFYREVNLGELAAVDPTLGSAPPLGTGAKSEDQWRTVLIGGLRNGGRAYYALDITEPPESASVVTDRYPRYLWGFPCEDCAAANTLNPGTAAEVAFMGNTWSEPVITRVRVKAENGSDPRGYERWVAIFGAGYHPNGDPNGSNYLEPGDVGFTAQGRAIYMVDITTGEVLAKKAFDSTASPLTSTPQVGIREMQYAIASSPAVFDLDFDGFADVVYIGDLGGNVWKWVVEKVGDDPINNVTTNKNLAQPNWPFRRIFRAGTSLEPSLPPEQLGAAFNDLVHYQSFFFPPTGVLRSGQLLLGFGAGERANPTGPSALFNDGDLSNNNHYYVVKDRDPRERSVSTPNPISGSQVEADLDDLSAGAPQTCEGYFITARDAEKFVTNSVIFLGELFTASFLPADPASTDPCAASGEAFLYRFDIDCGGGAYPSNPGNDDDKRRIAIGEGFPTRPRVSVGGLNDGGSQGSCKNKVVVITSDGQINNDCPGPLPSTGINIDSWRER